MVAWISLLLLPQISLSAFAQSTVRGVDPDLAKKYVPSKSNTWTCLDGSREIPWSAVNDDFCDCADGSDEPGTSACPNGQFYCENAGHIGEFIPSSRVRDGLCESDCCDGSDEAPGVCPNRCKEIGEAYRKKRAEEDKIRKAGGKIRAEYIAFAHKEKKRLEDYIVSLTKDIAVKEKDVARLKDIAERTESTSKAALEYKKQSPLYQSILKHNKVLKSLQREYKKHVEREKALGDILDALRRGYNPNYQDMAVLEAVRGWEELAGLPHINDVKKGDNAAEGEDNAESEGEQDDSESEQEEPVDDGTYTADELQYEVDPLLNTDYTSLLLEHDEHINAPYEGTSLLFDVAAYLPDSLVPHYEEFRDNVVSWLEKLGIVRGGGSETTESQRAQIAFSDAEGALRRVQTAKTQAEAELAKLFDPAHYGPKGEWKKLGSECTELDNGEYTYELCFFQEARQIPNNGGSTFSLGRFRGWNTVAQPGEPEYYLKQYYKGGARCWNGPERSVVVVLSCGVENEITSVQELEKCEYQYTATTPALCAPLEEKKKKSKGGREEL